MLKLKLLICYKFTQELSHSASEQVTAYEHLGNQRNLLVYGYHR